MTTLQLVQGAGDIEMRDRVLWPLFKEHYGNVQGIEEMQRQISEMKNVHQDFDFDPIIMAIHNELFNKGRDESGRWILSEETLDAIDQFRRSFDDNQPKIIDKGMQFNWQLLDKLGRIYTTILPQWHYAWDDKRGALLEDAVIAWVLRYATQNDKQRFNQGLRYLYNVIDVQQPFHRAQRNHDGINFDTSLQADSNDFVLAGSFPDIAHGLQRRRPGNGLFLPAAFQLDSSRPLPTSLLISIFADKKWKACQTLPQHIRSNVCPCAIL